jgi:hypothetical protein
MSVKGVLYVAQVELQPEYSPVKQWKKPIRRKDTSLSKYFPLSLAVVVLFLVAFVYIVTLWVTQISNYEVHYKEYKLKPRDTVFNVVQEHNDYMPWGWDARDLISLTKDANHLNNVGSVKAGDTILIPIIKPKEK